MNRPPLTLALALLLSALGRAAHAQTTELFLDQSACVLPSASTAPPSPLSAAIAIELLDADLHPAAEFAVGRVGLTLNDCDLSDGRISLELVRAPLAEPASTELVLSDVPEPARPRTAAVAVVEWLRALHHAAPDNRPAPTPPPAPPSPVIPQREAPPARAPTLQQSPITSASQRKASVLVQLGGGVTFLGKEPIILPGGRLTLREEFLPRWWLIGGVSYFATSKDTILGRAQLHVLLYEAALGFNVLPTPWLTLSCVAQWGPSWALGKSELGIDERSRSRSLIILRGRVELKVPLAQRWALTALADFGPILRGVDYTAAGQPAFSLRAHAGEGSLHLEFAP
jgi:hypothetical protein